jgi:glycosyltransferase involved in cell wall biosynthesis
MKILHVTYGSPKRLARGGGSLGMFQNLQALLALGHEVHLAVLGRAQPIEDEVRSMVRGLYEIEPGRAPLHLRPLQRVLNPETFELRFPAGSGFRRQLARLVDQLRPDVVWADSIFALAAAPRRVAPTVFGHYDFLFRLKAVRRATSKLSFADLRAPAALRRRIRRPDALTSAGLESLELRLAAQAAHVMCVSASEAAYLTSRGVPSTHIPIVGPTIPAPATESTAGPRFFLFGNHNTAHASALAEIRHQLWPALERAGGVGEWHQIGKPPASPDEDWRWMERSFHSIHGFVEDLSTLFRIGDISVVPYRHDTGFRTKFTVAAGYGVASAGFIESFLCAPEFTPDRDCVAGKDVEGLAVQLRRAIDDRAYRLRIGQGARQLYERAYTFEAQVPRYAEILKAARRSATR